MCASWFILGIRHRPCNAMAHSVSNIQDLSDRAAMMDLPITLLVSWCASIILARPFGHLQAPTTTVLLQGLQYQSTQLLSKVVHMYEAKQVGQCKNKTGKCSPSSVTAKKALIEISHWPSVYLYGKTLTSFMWWKLPWPPPSVSAYYKWLYSKYLVTTSDLSDFCELQ